MLGKEMESEASTLHHDNAVGMANRQHSVPSSLVIGKQLLFFQ